MSTGKKVGAFTVAAAVGGAAVALVLGACSGETASPAGEPASSDVGPAETVSGEAAELVGIAETFMKARNANDIEKAISLLSADGVEAVLLYDNQIEPGMGSVLVPDDEYALAFEAERLYGVRYEDIECYGDPPVWDEVTADVICTFSLDSKLRRLAGYPPVRSVHRLGLREGRIDVLSFPWLNISWNGSYFPDEFEQFVHWLDAEHPEAFDGEPPIADDSLFRNEGQEWILKLNRESLDFLKRYLQEYERSLG